MNHIERSHAPLSPSSFKRLMECPGSYYLTKDLPDEPPSKYAAEGTYVHERIEYYWAQAVFPIPIIEDDPEIQECIEGYFQFIIDLENKFKELCTEEEKKTIRRFIEKRVHFSENIWGTLDYGLSGIRNGKLEILVVDYKHGAGVKVSAIENPQTVIYGLGLNKELEEKADKIRCYIYQPRAGGEKPYSSFVLDQYEIAEWDRKIRAAEYDCLSLLNRENRDSLVKFGGYSYKSGDHCRFCKAIATCPERNKTALSLIEPIKEIKDLPIIPLEKLVDIFKAKKQIEHLLDATESYLTRFAETGVQIPGLKLVQTKGKRSWAFKGKELEKYLVSVIGAAGIDIEKAYKPERSLINLLEAEKLLGKDALKKLVSLPAVRNQLVSIEDERVESEIINLIEEIK